MQPSVTGADTVGTLLARRARAHPDREFLVFEGVDGAIERFTYAEMFERARRTAAGLQERGVEAESMVHVHFPNCPEFFDVWFATALIGGVMVPTNPLLTAKELRYIIDHAGCALTVSRPELLDAVADARADNAIVASHELRSGKPADVSEALDPTGVAAVMYTSGTTSSPKGVLVTHANYVYAGEVVAQHLRLRPDDRWLVVLPLFHANAQYYSTMSALVTGGSLALMGRFSASRWGEQAARHGATVAGLFAAPIRMILAQGARKTDRDNCLRAVIFSQNVTEEQLRAFERRFGAPLLQLYGMTETMAPPTLNPLYGERRNMSIGRPTLPARVRVARPDGSDARAGEVGELLVGGQPGVTLMRGYLKNAEATAAALRDGWLCTGDNVRADADGYLYFVDRGKDMIKRAGENVSAGEIEAVVNDHPDVFESAVIGVADEMQDEAIKVFVVARAGTALSEDEVIAWCSDRLARFKVPGVVEFVEALPRTSVGKIRKEVLRMKSEQSAPPP